MKTAVVLFLTLSTLPLLAQSSAQRLPDSPSVALASARIPAKPFAIRENIRPVTSTEQRDPHRRAFLLLSTAAVISTIADAELTAHCVATNPDCREVNPLYGSHPTRARLYLTSAPFTVAQIWFSNRLRKKYPEKKLWMLPTISVTAVHSFGAASGAF
jgi:hypothetical protein